MARDPVCGMTVEPERAPAKASHADATYYFCCNSCADKFQAAPDKYLSASSTSTYALPTQMPSQFVQLGAAKISSSTTAFSSDAEAEASPLSARQAAATATPFEFSTGMARGSVPVQQKPNYICPMDPEVSQDHPGACPKCGMALEPAVPLAPATRIEYTCPMHPQIVRPGPGSCPICGMALEPRTATVEDEENPELVSMTRRFWVSVGLTIPVLVLGMSSMVPGLPMGLLSALGLSMNSTGWIELLFATPVVLWGGWPFFERGWASVVNRSLNMFTLIALGTGTAYASLQCDRGSLPREFLPPSFRRMNGVVPVAISKRRQPSLRSCCWVKCLN